MIPFVTIALDKPRRLRYGMGASIEFEQLTGVKMTAIGEDEMSMDTIAKLLYAGLKHEDKNLTVAKVVDLVDNHAESITSVIEKITEAINAAYKSKNA